MTHAAQLLADGWLPITPHLPDHHRVIGYCARHRHCIGGVYRVNGGWEMSKGRVPVCVPTHYREMGGVKGE